MIENIAQTVPLNDGSAMPGYGFGCYKADGGELQEAILAAAEFGYRLLDTASYYKNEEVVGASLRMISAPMYVISKIWPCEFDNPVKALDGSLKRLGLDRIDAYLLHWPGLDEKARLKAYETLLRQREKGKIGSLGVSNFMEPRLVEIHAEFGLWPSINQIECHPYYPQTGLCGFCAKNSIQVMAWGPLGRGAELADPVILAFAEEKDATSAQIILRWHVENNIVPIPKSVHKNRIRENARIFGFELDAAQMEAIDALSRKDGRQGADPAEFPQC